ncbi:hypothetical protein D3C73_1046330 [compost metagenome]
MEREADINHERSSVFKCNQRIGQVLNRIVFSIIIRGLIEAEVFNVRSVAELFIGVSLYSLHLWSAHEIPAKINDMHPDINEWTSAGAFLIREPSSRIAQAPEEAGLGIINFSQIPGIDKPLQNLDIRSVAADISDLKKTAGTMNCFLYEQGFIYGFAQRFLAQYIFTCL